MHTDSEKFELVKDIIKSITSSPDYISDYLSYLMVDNSFPYICGVNSVYYEISAMLAYDNDKEKTNIMKLLMELPSPYNFIKVTSYQLNRWNSLYDITCNKHNIRFILTDKSNFDDHVFMFDEFKYVFYSEKYKTASQDAKEKLFKLLMNISYEKRIKSQM